MALTETELVAKAAFVFAWGILNFAWLALLRRPIASAALSLAMLALLVLLSLFKYSVLWMTANFVDLMIIDPDTIAFLLTVFPDLKPIVAVAAIAATVGTVTLWRLDPFRVQPLRAVAGAGLCAAGLAAVSFAVPMMDHEAFRGTNHVSGFFRSGVDALSAMLWHGYIESDAAVADQLKPAQQFSCEPVRKRPHIVLVHDESSFDIRVAPGVKVPADYGAHFLSFDGKERRFVVETSGGASWYTEYNVLAGLSARSFGRFAYFVTRIAARHLQRGLPLALRECGYRTLSLYPSRGAFMSARKFQAATGVQRVFDARDMGSQHIEPDRFYYDVATRLIAQGHRDGPMFLYVYLAANHFPWEKAFRPDLLPPAADNGNSPVVNEYLRRQKMSARDYADFLATLRESFPGEPFLLVRYGDHQPDFAPLLIDPTLDEAGIGQRLMTFDPRYYTTYYAIDAVNFTPAELGAARETLDGPYLPLVVLEAAGLPLDPSFAEQKQILERCNGAFYACGGGAEARRFNRLLIDAGLLKGL